MYLPFHWIMGLMFRFMGILVVGIPLFPFQFFCFFIVTFKLCIDVYKAEIQTSATLYLRFVSSGGMSIVLYFIVVIMIFFFSNPFAHFNIWHSCGNSLPFESVIVSQFNIGIIIKCNYRKWSYPNVYLLII